MLSEKEKEAIETAKKELEKTDFITTLKHKDLKIILNLIPRLQREKEIYVGLMHQYQKECLDLKEELREKDKEIQKYKNMYQAEHDIHLVRNEQLERKERGLQSLQKQLLEKDKMINLITTFLGERDLGYYKKQIGGELIGQYHHYEKEDWEKHFEELIKEEGANNANNM